MSFLGNLFGGADNASKAQQNAIWEGLALGSGSIDKGNQALETNYTSALQPFLSNYSTAQTGVSKLGDLLGLNGASGSQNAQAALATMPGYQFALQQGNNAVNAAAAANGTLNSGNQLLALQKTGQGLASQNYNNYVSQLQPYLNYSNSSASGIGSLYSGLGNQINSNYNNLAGMQIGALTGIGNAQAQADLADQSMGMGLLGGALKLGTSLFSDERLKENIEPVGELFDGTSVYRYNYKGDNRPQIGVMAQEIEQKYPDAVSEVGGFKAVHYGVATEMASELGKFLNKAA